MLHVEKVFFSVVTPHHAVYREQTALMKYLKEVLEGSFIPRRGLYSNEELSSPKTSSRIRGSEMPAVFASLATTSAGFRFSASFAAFCSSFSLSFLAFASSRSWRTLAVSASRAAFARNLSCAASSFARRVASVAAAFAAAATLFLSLSASSASCFFFAAARWALVCFFACLRLGGEFGSSSHLLFGLLTRFCIQLGA
jgi:hypothetical protein